MVRAISVTLSLPAPCAWPTACISMTSLWMAGCTHCSESASLSFCSPKHWCSRGNTTATRCALLLPSSQPLRLRECASWLCRSFRTRREDFMWWLPPAVQPRPPTHVVGLHPLCTPCLAHCCLCADVSRLVGFSQLHSWRPLALCTMWAIGNDMARFLASIAENLPWLSACHSVQTFAHASRTFFWRVGAQVVTHDSHCD